MDLLIESRIYSSLIRRYRMQGHPIYYLDDTWVDYTQDIQQVGE